MKQNINTIVKKVQKNINPATFKKAVISSVNISSNTADVYFVDNPQTTIKAIPFAASMNASLVQSGSKCRVDIFDETNPDDMVIAYTYGGTILSSTKFAVGIQTITPSGVAIPHGLGVKPTFVSSLPQDTGHYTKSVSVSGGSGGTITEDQNAIVYQYQAPDTINIYLKLSTLSGATGGSSLVCYWLAAKI
jgi:hypothetical protein